jgi:hypothetical protein
MAGVERAAVTVALVPLAATAATAAQDGIAPSLGQTADVASACPPCGPRAAPTTPRSAPTGNRPPTHRHVKGLP